MTGCHGLRSGNINKSTYYSLPFVNLKAPIESSLLFVYMDEQVINSQLQRQLIDMQIEKWLHIFHNFCTKINWEMKGCIIIYPNFLRRERSQRM